jgi:hypothetical protein
MRASRPGWSAAFSSALGQALDGELALAGDLGAAGVGQQLGVLALVVVEAMASGTRIAGLPATANSQTVPAPERPITRWASRSRLAMSRKKGRSRRRPGVAVGRAGVFMDSARVCCWTISRLRRLSGRACDRLGTSSESSRAPWLPPVTSRRIGPSARRLDRACRPARGSAAHGIADHDGLLGHLRRRLRQRREGAGHGAHVRRQHAVGRPITAFCSWITVGRRSRIAPTRAGADG